MVISRFSDSDQGDFTESDDEGEDGYRKGGSPNGVSISLNQARSVLAHRSFFKYTGINSTSYFGSLLIVLNIEI